MSSLRKIQSAQANGRLSKGPVTPEGKQRSAINALRHGLMAKCLVLPGESPQTFELMFSQHVECFQPANGVEYALVEEMAAAYWRLRRNWAVEGRIFGEQIARESGPELLDQFAGAFVQLSAGTAMPLMHRYETRLHNMYQRAIRTFLQLREAALQNEPNPDSGHFDPTRIPGVDPSMLPGFTPSAPSSPPPPADPPSPPVPAPSASPRHTPHSQASPAGPRPVPQASATPVQHAPQQAPPSLPDARSARPRPARRPVPKPSVPAATCHRCRPNRLAWTVRDCPSSRVPGKRRRSSSNLFARNTRRPVSRGLPDALPSVRTT